MRYFENLRSTLSYSSSLHFLTQKKATQVNLSSVLIFFIFYCFFDLYIVLWGKSALSKSALELFKGSLWVKKWEKNTNFWPFFFCLFSTLFLRYQADFFNRVRSITAWGLCKISKQYLKRKVLFEHFEYWKNGQNNRKWHFLGGFLGEKGTENGPIWKIPKPRGRFPWGWPLGVGCIQFGQSSEESWTKNWLFFKCWKFEISPNFKMQFFHDNFELEL